MFPHHKLDWNIRRLEKHLDELPDDASARLEYASASLAKAWFHEGGEMWFNKALTQARRVLQNDPRSPGALVVAGLSLLLLDRVEPAQKYLDEALVQEPERADVRLALGILHDQQGDRHAAVRELETACRLAPADWEPHYLLGQMLAERAAEAETGNGAASPRLMERSQFHIVKALALDPSPSVAPALLYDLAVSCVRGGRLAEAHRILQRLLENDRYKSKARYWLGLVLFQMGKYKNAILALRQHLDDHPDNVHVHARIGMAYLHLGEIDKAREACNRALAVEPGDLQARWTLGCALLEENLTDDAMRMFKDILADAPDHVPAFTELVRLRTTSGDDGARWLAQALRAEVSIHDRLPVTAEREATSPVQLARPGPRRDHRRVSTIEVSPRATTRDRIGIVLRSLSELPSPAVDATKGILESVDLTTDEGLRFQLWEAALDHMAAQRARDAVGRLKTPGTGYQVAAGREILALCSVIPEPLLTKGLQVSEEDLKRAAVDRYPPTSDVQTHRGNIDRERQEARAWQALLLLAIASRQTRSGKNLLVRWASDADSDLADAARAALGMLGDPDAIARLRERAKARGASHLVEALLAEIGPSEARFSVRPVSDDEELHCTTCGKRAPEVDHLMAGGDAVLCDTCMMSIAKDRRELQSDDPAVCCALCGRSGLDSRGVYLLRGTGVCAECVDHSLGLLEREEVDRYLATC